MKYIHKPIEVEAMKFTLTEAKNPDSLAFSQFGIQDRSKTNSWSYWKTPESLTVPGRFFLRTKQHSTMMVAVGDWVVKDSTGHVTLMDDKRFNELYRAAPAVKSPPQEDWREVIKTSGLSYEKIKEAYAKVLPKIVYEISKPSEARFWGTPAHDWMEGPPSAIGAIMADVHKKMEQEFKKQRDDYIDTMTAYMKGAHYDVHRTDSTDRETGPSDCCNRGTCEGCKGDK